jgi:hypothetical protein
LLQGAVVQVLNIPTGQTTQNVEEIGVATGVKEEGQLAMMVIKVSVRSPAINAC